MIDLISNQKNSTYLEIWTKNLAVQSPVRINYLHQFYRSIMIWKNLSSFFNQIHFRKIAGRTTNFIWWINITRTWKAEIESVHVTFLISMSRNSCIEMSAWISSHNKPIREYLSLQIFFYHFRWKKLRFNQFDVNKNNRKWRIRFVISIGR